MSPKLKIFLQRWLINTAAVLVAASLVKGIRFDTLGLLAGTFLLGILNTFLRPLLMLLSLPLMIFTLGLFTLVINAFLLYLVGSILSNFHVDSFWSAFWGDLIISIVSEVLYSLTGSGDSRIRVQRGNRPPDHPDQGGDGPIIDV